MCVRPRNSSGRVDCFDLSRCLRSGQYKYTTSSYEPLVNIMRKFRGLLSWGVVNQRLPKITCVSRLLSSYMYFSRILTDAGKSERQVLEGRVHNRDSRASLSQNESQNLNDYY